MKLTVRIFDDERGGFVATCPSLPGCCCRGRTREDAKREIDEAIRGYLAAVGNFVPETVVQDLLEV
jgi:antitoxin HicB